MSTLDHHQVMVMLLALGVLLTAARVLGELARRFRQPAVLGEITAGILLGPTVLGHAAPAAFSALFPADGPNAVALHAITTLCVVLFMLVAGMEVDLSTIFKLRRSALVISLSGLALPFGVGFLLARTVPSFVGMEPGANGLAFSLFLGTALAISALPVIAKILMDLNLYRSDLGMVVVAAAIVNDLVGWVIFAIILGIIGGGGGAATSVGAAGIATTVVMTLGFACVMLTAGRWAIDRVLPWIHAHVSWPAGVLSFATAVGLLAAACTEWIGIHAIFGAFMAGMGLGASKHLQQRTRSTIEQFIAAVFAPLFFASIGLRVDFVAHFDLALVLTILAVACVGQVLGSSTGARMAGFRWRQSWAIGFALNARGAMEIVLALLALQAGVIGQRLFVALVVMALATSILAGPVMQAVLRRPRPLRLRDFVGGRTFVPWVHAGTAEDVIRRLALAAAPAAGVPAERIHAAVWEREQTMSTALGHGLAVPHGRIAGLERPVVAVGLLPHGVSFDARDGQPARLVIMILTPLDAVQAQLELVADVARTFARPQVVGQAVEAATFTRFLALLNTEGGPEGAGRQGGA